MATAPAGPTEGIPSALPGLKGKRVLVTGGSAGIGRATVLAFAASGATVCAAARRAERLDAVVAAAPKGSKVHRVVLDLTKEESCKAAVKDAVKLMGGLDVVVNCGGVTTGDAKHMDFKHWAEMASLHVSSAWVIAQAASPELKKSGKGSIVNVTSDLSIVPSASPDWTSYHCMKAAQDQVTKSLALQLAKDSVRFNAVAPGVIMTEAIESMAAKNGKPVEALVGYMATMHPVGRIGAAEEVANAIGFLASDLASFITGAIVPVDGGAVLTSWINKEPL